eukprot:Hpha_TRINITY_DN14378_c0_g1::TRINITY_DN14378_c0_g1_i1::g.86588::m.86588
MGEILPMPLSSSQTHEITETVEVSFGRFVLRERVRGSHCIGSHKSAEEGEVVSVGRSGVVATVVHSPSPLDQRKQLSRKEVREVEVGVCPSMTRGPPDFLRVQGLVVGEVVRHKHRGGLVEDLGGGHPVEHKGILVVVVTFLRRGRSHLDVVGVVFQHTLAVLLGDDTAVGVDRRVEPPRLVIIGVFERPEQRRLHPVGGTEHAAHSGRLAREDNLVESLAPTPLVRDLYPPGRQRLHGEHPGVGGHFDPLRHALEHLLRVALCPRVQHRAPIQWDDVIHHRSHHRRDGVQLGRQEGAVVKRHEDHIPELPRPAAPAPKGLNGHHVEGVQEGHAVRRKFVALLHPVEKVVDTPDKADQGVPPLKVRLETVPEVRAVQLVTCQLGEVPLGAGNRGSDPERQLDAGDCNTELVQQGTIVFEVLNRPPQHCKS